MTHLMSSGDLGFLECHLKAELGAPDVVGVFLNVPIYIFELIAGNYAEDGRRDLETEILCKMVSLHLYLCKILGPGVGRWGGREGRQWKLLSGCRLDPRLDLDFPNSCFHVCFLLSLHCLS